MATNAVPVGADQKDQEGVKEVEANVPGVGMVKTYFKVETVDDVDGKTTKDVDTYKLSVPVQAEEEVEETDENGEVKKDNQGNPVMKKETFWQTKHVELDMGPANRDKLLKALEPFLKNAREAKAPVVAARAYTAPTLPEGVDTAAVRAWAQSNDIKVNGKPINEKGRVPQAFIDEYTKAHPKS